MNIAFDGVAEVIATFETSEVTEGYPVVVSANGTVTDAADGEVPAGVAVGLRNGNASVLMKGYVELPVTDAALGWKKLAANGTGGLKVTTGDGITCLVVTVDSTAGTAGLFL